MRAGPCKRSVCRFYGYACGVRTARNTLHAQSRPSARRVITLSMASNADTVGWNVLAAHARPAVTCYCTIKSLCAGQERIQHALPHAAFTDRRAASALDPGPERRVGRIWLVVPKRGCLSNVLYADGRRCWLGLEMSDRAMLSNGLSPEMRLCCEAPGIPREQKCWSWPSAGPLSWVVQ